MIRPNSNDKGVSVVIQEGSRVKRYTFSEVDVIEFVKESKPRITNMISGAKGPANSYPDRYTIVLEALPENVDTKDDVLRGDR